MTPVSRPAPGSVPPLPPLPPHPERGPVIS